MKRLLLVDTCGSAGSVALADCDEAGEVAVLAAEVLPGRSASERLVPVVRQMLARHGWRLAELAAIAVARGPGSFTGVRVGLSAVKGWSEASGVPLIALSRLEVLAVQGGDSTAHVWAILDAGRGEFYGGEYGEGRCVRELLLTGEELRRAAEGARIVVCEMKVAEVLEDLAPVMVAEPGAAELLPLAMRRLQEGAFDDVALLDANYLRRMEQEIAARIAAAGR